MAIGLAALCARPTLGHAQGAAGGVSDEHRAAARALANQAADAYEAEDYQKAADLFRRAYVLMPVPTLSIYEARSLQEVGRLVEALEAFQRTAQAKLDESAPDVFVQVVNEAQPAIALLEPRIPSLRIVVSGPGHDDPELEVTMDGRPVAKVLIGIDRPVDPGDHEVEASTPSGAHAKATVTLAEREKGVVELKLQGESVAAAPLSKATQPTAAPTAAPSTSEPAVAGDPAAAGSAQRTWGYVGLGLGGAGLGLGVATGVMAMNRLSDAEAACQDHQCVEGSPGAEDAETFHRLRTVSTIGYALGAVGVGAGITLLLTAPSEPAGESDAQLSPCLGIGSVGVRGRF